jgi:hypothetical protein
MDASDADSQQLRRAAALRAWSAARRDCRGDAHLARLLESELGAAASTRLDELHRRRLHA